MGAGASEGLDSVLQRMLLEAKLKQQSDIDSGHLAETTRHNLAAEDLAGRQHQLQSMDTQARIRESEAAHADTNAARIATEGRAAAEAIPGGTVIPESDPAVGQMQRAGMGSILRGLKSRPAVDVGPLQPEDTGAAVPTDSVIKLKTNAQREKDAADSRATAGTDERIRHDKAMENKAPAPDRVLIQTPEGYVRRSDATTTLANGGTVSGPESAQTKNRRDMADAVGSHFDDVNSLLDEADKKGLLGPLKGRTFVEFMSGKVGSTGDAASDELLGELRTQLSMIRTGVASLHGRTGANVGIARDIEKKMDEGYMDPAMIRGSLKGLKSWVDKYAKKPGADGTAATPSGAKVIRYDMKGNIIP